MTPNTRLLEDARAAGEKLAVAEREALLARAEYHTAIRRLHLAGTSFREIAQALSLSHQRVQQVVQAAGGSWWQVWRRRGEARDAVCTWCDRPPSEVAQLIAGPKVYICGDCVTVASQALATPPRSGAAGGRQRCDFCRHRPSAGRAVFVGPPNVCNQCLQVCRDILNSRAE